MVVGHHLVWTAYGWWLPNDPRGSSSHEIRVPELEALGELHHGRKKIQPAGADRCAFYQAADPVLRHDRPLLDDDAIALVGQSIAQTMARRRYTCFACAVMPDHVRVLIRKHRDCAETMIEHFQADRKQALLGAGKRPATHPVWGGPGWKVYEDTREAMERTIRSIADNPLKIGRPPQLCPFVQPYDG